MTYLWQRDRWPDLTWRADELLEPLGRARFAQGRILERARGLALEAQARIVTEDAVTTAAIEGETLPRDSVRSSVARHLGLPTAGLPPSERAVDGLVEMLLDATGRAGEPLTAARLQGWHGALFPTGRSGLREIAVASWRKGDEPMRVVSGRFGRERVHFEAPPSKEVGREMRSFLAWWRSSAGTMDGLVRAAVAHLRFLTVHPFDDGNGRIARALSDMALAQDEGTGCRVYSLSAQILAEREAYYGELETTQRGDGDVTDWIAWFLGCLERSIGRSEGLVAMTLRKESFWVSHADVSLRDRQRKVLNRLLDAGPDGFEGGMTNRKYVALTRVSPETAKRDLAELVDKGFLVRRPGGGRSASYGLADEPT